MLDMHVALKKWAAFFQWFATGKGRPWLGAVAKKEIKPESEKWLGMEPSFPFSSSTALRLHWGEAESTDVKWLKDLVEEER